MSNTRMLSLKHDIHMIKHACDIIHQLLPVYISGSPISVTLQIHDLRIISKSQMVIELES